MPISISKHILQYNIENIEKKSYAIDSEFLSFKNEFYKAANNVKLNNLGILSDYIYIDINDTCEHSIIKLIYAIINHKTIKNENHKLNMPILTYQSKTHATFFNN